MHCAPRQFYTCVGHIRLSSAFKPVNSVVILSSNSNFSCRWSFAMIALQRTTTCSTQALGTQLRPMIGVTPYRKTKIISSIPSAGPRRSYVQSRQPLVQRRTVCTRGFGKDGKAAVGHQMVLLQFHTPRVLNQLLHCLDSG